MIKIFAKFGTDEKIAVYCHPGQKNLLIISFEKQFGGRWLLVDEVFTSNEILMFNDGQIYNGFEPAQPDRFRYSKAIKNFKF